MFHQTVSRMAKHTCQCPHTSLFQAFHLQPTVFVRALSVDKLCCHCIGKDMWNNTLFPTKLSINLSKLCFHSFEPHLIFIITIYAHLSQHMPSIRWQNIRLAVSVVQQHNALLPDSTTCCSSTQGESLWSSAAGNITTD